MLRNVQCSILYFGLLATSTASAWDSQTVLPDLLPGVLHPHGVASDTIGFWASGDALVRYDELGEDGIVSHVLNDRVLLVASGDGGVVSSSENLGPYYFEPPLVPCTLRGYDGHGIPLWQNQIDVLACDQVGVDAGGRIWATTGNIELYSQITTNVRDLYLLNPRGERIAHLSQSTSIKDLLADPREQNVFVYDGATLKSYNYGGTKRWDHAITGSGAAGGRLALNDDHTLVLAEAGYTGDTLHVLKFDVGGALRWQQNLTVTPVPSAVLAVAAAPDGSVFVLDRNNTESAAFTLRRLDANGNLTWSKPLDSAYGDCARLRSRCVLRVSHAGAVVLAMRESAHAIDPSLPANFVAVVVETYSGDGQRIEHLALAGERLGGFATLTDDATLVAAHFTQVGETQPYSTAHFADGWVKVGTDGHAVAAPQTENARAEPGRTIFGLVTNQGDSYVLRADGIQADIGEIKPPSHYALSRVGADGALKWDIRGDGEWTNGASLVADANRVCAGGLFLVPPATTLHWRDQCFDRASGATLWSRVAEGNDDAYSGGASLALLPDHGLVSVAGLHRLGRGGTGQHRRYAADGTLQHELGFEWGFPYPSSVACNSAGDCVISDFSTQRYFNADGTQRYSVTVPKSPSSAERLQLYSLFLQDDGSTMALGSYQDDLSGLVLWSLAPDASQRLLRTLPATFQSGVSRQLQRVGKDFALVVGGNPGYLARINPAGDLLWQRQLVLPSNVEMPPLPDPGPWVLLSYERYLSLVVVDGSNGQDIARRHESCADEVCAIAPPRVDDGGRLHVIFYPGVGVTHASVFGLDHLVAPGTPVRIDQHALTGAWWANYTGGQGFMLDYLPATHTLFMPWFTFTTSGDNAASEQRWYTLQGSVPENAKSLTLPIYDSRGGAFDAATPTTPTHVGDATLQFDDCDNASLHYVFLPAYNDGRVGDISLSRLLPREEACLHADGTSEPPPAGSPGRRSFDAKLNGSWYEPATAGQGLQLEIWPGHLLFAAWFTYDPAGRSDDATQQHWLTLQGSLGSGSGNTATVLIAQAVGGSLDAQVTHNQYTLGHATLTVQSCDHITLDYQFDDADLAGAYRARAGSIDLVKIGGCTP